MDRDELVRAACNGDVEARDELASWLLDKVENFFAKSRKSSSYVDELCQATIEDVWIKLPVWQPATEAEFLRFVYGIAWTSRLRARSRDAREHDRQEKLQQVPAPTPTRSPTSKLAQREIADRYLPELATPLRDVVLWAIQGRTLVEYAETRGIPEGTARSRYRRGLNRLRQRLADDGLTPSQCGL